MHSMTMRESTAKKAFLMLGNTVSQCYEKEGRVSLNLITMEMRGTTFYWWVFKSEEKKIP